MDYEMKTLAALIFGVCLLAGIVALAQTTTDYDSLVQDGRTQLQAGNAKAALATARAAIRVDTARWEAYALAGGALMNLKQYEEAADELSDAISRAPQTKQSALRD